MVLTNQTWRAGFYPKCMYNTVLPIVTPDGRYLPCCFCHGDNHSLREWAKRQNLNIDHDMRLDGRTAVEIVQSESYQTLRRNFTIDGADLPYVCEDNCKIDAYESIDGGSKWKAYNV